LALEEVYTDKFTKVDTVLFHSKFVFWALWLFLFHESVKIIFNTFSGVTHVVWGL